MSNIVTPTGDPPADPSKTESRAFHHGNLRRALLEAALTASDIEGISLRQIAARVGVTPAAAYRHFENREALLDEVARIGFDRLAMRFARAFDIFRVPADAPEARSRLIRLAEAYLQFADEETALWRLLFGTHGARYRATGRPNGRPDTYSYLTVALDGLYHTGTIARATDARDEFFAWSAIHGAAALRNGHTSSALAPVAQLAREIALRVIRSMQSPP